MRRLITLIWLALLPVLAPFLASAQQADSAAEISAEVEDDKGFLTRLLEENLSGAGRQVTLTGFRGALSSRATFDLLTIADDEGVWIALHDGAIQWNRSALLARRVEIDELSAARIELPRLPNAAETPERRAEARDFALPELPVGVEIRKIDAQRVEIGEPVVGEAAVVSVNGSLTLKRGEGTADLAIERIDGKRGIFTVDAGFSNTTRQLKVDLTLDEAADGILANIAGIEGKPALKATIDGEGPLDDFHADVSLATDGEPRVTGNVTIADAEGSDGSAGTGFRVRLGGDVAALLPATQRSFFGDRAQLLAEGWRGADGRLEIPVLLVGTEALNISGALAITASGTPQSAVLMVTLGKDAGATALPVRLPLSGEPTTVQTGRLQFSYDAAQGDGWTLDGYLGQFTQGDLTIAAVDLDGSGTVALESGAVAQVGGRVTFDASGIAPGDPALAQAVGDTLKGGTRFDWTPGNAVDLAELEVNGSDYHLAGNARADGLGSGITVSGRLDGQYADLSRLSGLAGTDLAGQADLSIEGHYTVLSRGFDVEATLAGTDLGIGQPQLDRLLGGRSDVELSARRDETGITLQEARITAPRLNAQASGTVSSDASDIKGTLTMGSLSDVDPSLAGSLTVDAALSGPAGGRRIAVNGKATDLTTGIAPLDAALRGSTDLVAIAAEDEGAYDLRTFRLANPQLSLEGEGALTPGATDVALRLSVPDLAAFGLGWSGDLAATGRVSDTPEGRRFTLEGTGEELRLGAGQVNGALSGTTRFSVAGLQQDDSVTLERAEITNDQARISATGTLSGTGTDLSAEASIAALESLGLGWKGSLDLTGRVTDDGSGVRQFALNGRGEDLALGQQQVDGALQGTTTIALRGSQSPDGIVIDEGRLVNDGAEITAQGRVGKEATDLTGAVRIASLADLGRGWRGSLDLTGSFVDDGSDARRLTVTGTGEDLALGQAQVDGALTGTTSLDIRAVERDGVFTIEAAELVNDQARLSATGTIGGGSTDASAHVEMARLEALGIGWRGSIAADATLHEDGDGVRHFTLDGTGRDLAMGQAQVDTALQGPTRFTIKGAERAGVVTLDEAVIDNARLSATAAGTVGGGETDMTASLRADNLAFLGGGLRGGVTAEGKLLQSGGGAVDITASGEARGLAIGNPTADALLAGTTRFDLSAQTTAGDLVIRSLEATNPQLRVTASGALSRGVTIDARLANVALLAPGFDGPATAAGTVSRSGETLRMDLALTGPGGTTATLAGTAAQNFSTADLSISGRTDAALVNPLLRVRSIQGPVDFNLRLNGRPSLEALSGTIALPDAQLSDPKLGLRIEGLRLTADLSGGSAAITGSGRLADGGSVAVDGRLGLAGGRPIDVAVRLDQAVLRDPNLYETVVTGSVQATGTLAEGPLISGRLVLERTEIRIPSTGLGGARDIPEIIHLGERPPSRRTRAKAGLTPFPGSAATEAGLAGPPATPPTIVARLDVTISAPRQVFIRGRGVDAEMGGEIRITGTARDVIPIGTMELIRGRIDLLGKRFDLTEGLLELQGSLIPVIRLVAETEQDGVLTRIILDGEARDPRITFESVPDMPQEEVLSQLLFGRGLETISALQAAQLANAVAVLAGRGGEGIVGNLRKQVGLDDLDLGTDDEGNVSVRAGKYISDNLYSEVEVGADGTSRINLNLDISKSLQARGSVDNDGDTSLGIFYERDY